MKSVANILKSKANPSVYSIAPAASVFEALQLMAHKNIGALLVLDGGDIVGIFTERDYARKIDLKGRTSQQTMVREAMSSAVIVVDPAQTSDQCMALMTTRKLRHLPVVEGDQLLGLISIGDLVKDIIAEQQFIIGQLERYIVGSRG